MLFSILLFLSLLIVPQSVMAITDPLSVPNNRYGIHVTDMSDLTDAATLLNSNGGDWGYVTIVIPENERNVGRWQEHFNLMRRLHLIPIVRIATHVENAHWVIPQAIDADKWVNFLNSLNWPTKNRYVVLFNEPNHAKEWGGTINPEEYVVVAESYRKAFKNTSDDFFVLPAGLDFSASSDGKALDASEYLRKMYTKSPDFFSAIDGWVSHSYPNPGFSSPPTSIGRGTIASFIFEQQELKQLGVTKKLPIFITETGWQHSQGKIFDVTKATPEKVSEYITTAAHGIWQNENVVAITPFLLNYQDIPFDHFSFQKYRSEEFYPHFYGYKNISKAKGSPIQYENYLLETPLIPNSLVINSTYTVGAKLKNNGQNIVEPKTYDLTFESQEPDLTTFSEPLPYMESNESGNITMHIKTPKNEGYIPVKVYMIHDGRKTLIEEKIISIIPPPNISITVQTGFKTTATLKGVTVLVYDTKDTLIHKFPNMIVANNQVTVTGLYNMIPGYSYRLVILAPYYLPRQALVELTHTTTELRLKRLLPMDIDRDGAFTIKDVTSLILTKPRDVLGRWF